MVHVIFIHSASSTTITERTGKELKKKKTPISNKYLNWIRNCANCSKSVEEKDSEFGVKFAVVGAGPVIA